MANYSDYDLPPDDFTELIDDLANWKRDRLRQQRAREQDTMQKSLDFTRADLAEARDRNAMADLARGYYPVLDEIQEKLSILKATCDAWDRERPAQLAKAHAQAYATRLSEHKALCRRQIPQVLAKALDIQRRGGCSALDVARLQAECHHIAERFAL